MRYGSTRPPLLSTAKIRGNVLLHCHLEPAVFCFPALSRPANARIKQLASCKKDEKKLFGFPIVSHRGCSGLWESAGFCLLPSPATCSTDTRLSKIVCLDKVWLALWFATGSLHVTREHFFDESPWSSSHARLFEVVFSFQCSRYNRR